VWKLPPELAIELAQTYGAQGITYTYNELAVFIEYTYDVEVRAKKHGFFNTMVINGYMTNETVDLVAKYIDAATADLKGHRDK
jgi:pyruvate formate lyase activating enzyme